MQPTTSERFTTDLYFEAHITIEPVFDETLDKFKTLADAFQFRTAELMMKKRAVDKPERSVYDTFCTGRSKHYDDLKLRTLGLVQMLTDCGFKVWRYKIENTLLDVRLTT